MRKTPAELQFRAFVATDAAVLGPWLAEAGLAVPSGGSSKHWSERLVSDPRIRSRAACQGEDLVGFYRLDVAPDGAGELTFIVAPLRRRRGIGRALVEQALQEARDLQLRRMLAVVRSHNRGALDLLLDCGFEETGASAPDYVHLERILHRAGRPQPLEISP